MVLRSFLRNKKIFLMQAVVGVIFIISGYCFAVESNIHPEQKGFIDHIEFVDPEIISEKTEEFNNNIVLIDGNHYFLLNEVIVHHYDVKRPEIEVLKEGMFVYFTKDPDGRIDELWVIDPENVEEDETKDSKEIKKLVVPTTKGSDNIRLENGVWVN